MAFSVIALKCIFLVAIFVSTLGFTSIPLWIIPRDKNEILSHKSMRIIDFCNCFAGGVFLSTLFVGLIPFVREKFTETFLIGQVSIDYPVTEATILLGFFLNLLAEKCAMFIQSWNGKRRKDTKEKPVTKDTPSQHSTKHYAIVSSSSEATDDDGSDGEQEVMNGDTATNVTKKSKDTPSKSGHSQQNHHHHDDTHSGHGHSHLPVEAFKTTSAVRCVLLLLAMSVHGVFEGLAVGLQDEMKPLVGLYIAVIVHECLVSFAMGVSIAQQNLGKKTMVLLALCLCLMIPSGMAAGILLGKVQGFVGGMVNGVMQGIAGGTFLYVIFQEILPPAIEGKDDQALKLGLLLFGTVLIACLRVLIS